MRKYGKKGGFTLVEMLLAMSFVSGLLLAIALLIINIMSIYTKGVTMTAADRSGKLIISDLRQSLGQATATDVVYAPTKNGATTIGGRLCTGSVSYVWNYGDTLKNAASSLALRTKANKYSTGSPATSERYNIRFQKYTDTTGNLCKAGAGGAYPNLDTGNKSELLSANDRQIVVHSFTFSTVSVLGDGQNIYNVTMTIGTNNDDESTGIGGSRACSPPSEGNYDFCSVNTFEYSIRSGNSGE